VKSFEGPEDLHSSKPSSSIKSSTVTTPAPVTLIGSHVSDCAYCPETRLKLIRLRHDENGQSAERLQIAIEYKNGTNFRKILAPLHSARLIEHAPDGTCTISPSGLIEAEGIIRSLTDKPAAKKKTRR
jgi:hypothetical protein